MSQKMLQFDAFSKKKRDYVQVRPIPSNWQIKGIEQLKANLPVSENVGSEVCLAQAIPEVTVLCPPQPTEQTLHNSEHTETWIRIMPKKYYYVNDMVTKVYVVHHGALKDCT